MPNEISWEIRENAEDLYIIDGKTFDQVAEITGVSVSQLKRWSSSSDPTWPDRRREYRNTLKDIRRSTLKLREKLAQQALNTLDPQTIYALDRLEARAAKQEQPQSDGSDHVDRPKLFLESLEFIANVLKETDPEGLKVLGGNFDTLVKRFKEQHETTA